MGKPSPIVGVRSGEKRACAGPVVREGGREGVGARAGEGVGVSAGVGAGVGVGARVWAWVRWLSGQSGQACDGLVFARFQRGEYLVGGTRIEHLLRSEACAAGDEDA